MEKVDEYVEPVKQYWTYTVRNTFRLPWISWTVATADISMCIL